MAKRKSPEKDPCRGKKWDKVFNAMVKMYQNLQKDSQTLEDRINSLQQVIYQMKMDQKTESLRSELVLGLKEREAFAYKHRYETADIEVADFRELFDYLSQKCCGPTDPSHEVCNEGEGSRKKSLQAEVRRLETEIEKCRLEKNSEISALLAETNFVWNQFKRMENDLNEKLRKKREEAERANQKVQALVNRAEELQLTNERLRTDFAKMESDSVQKSAEVSRLLKEIELLKSRSGSRTPLLRQCRAKEATSHKGGKSNTDGRAILKKEANGSHAIDKEARTKPCAHKSTGGKAPRKQMGIKGSSSGSTRKSAEVVTIPDTPKLFTSSFKVPKLKPSSSPHIG